MLCLNRASNKVGDKRRGKKYKMSSGLCFVVRRGTKPRQQRTSQFPVSKTQYFDSILSKHVADYVWQSRLHPEQCRTPTLRPLPPGPELAHVPFLLLVTWRDAFVPEAESCEIGKSRPTFALTFFPCTEKTLFSRPTSSAFNSLITRDKRGNLCASWPRRKYFI